jgi:hypothetical protein
MNMEVGYKMDVSRGNLGMPGPMNSLKAVGRAVARWLSRPAGDSRGSPLVETIVALSIFGMVGVAVLSGVSSTRTSTSKTRDQSIAENVARNQMEYIFTLPYQTPTTTYATISDVPYGFSVTATAEVFSRTDPITGLVVTESTEIEKVIVKVSRDSRVILEVETLRAKE